MAMAATITIAEVEEIVEVGELDADSIVTPSIFVQRVVKGEIDAKWT
jgi:acyl CoA:acetate/3-ketoacid CoA transferase alpha subunit